MASATIYASAGDGHIANYQARGTWANVVSGTGTTKTVSYVATTGLLVYGDVGTTYADPTDYNYRAFLPFDLSSLSGATITAATLNVYISAKDIQGAFGSSIYVVTCGQASLTALATTDYNLSMGTTSLTTTNPTCSGLTTSAYLSLTLNASGLAALTPGGSAKLCVRNSVDFNGSAPVAYGFTSNYDSVTFQTSEGTNKPYLDITYTLPSGGAPLLRRDTRLIPFYSFPD